MIGTFKIVCAIVLCLVGAFAGGQAWAAVGATSPGLLSVGIDGDASGSGASVVLQIFALLTVLSIAPAILIMLTSFTRIAIVFGLLRQAMGTHQMPPNQVIIGLALFLTFYIMSPVWTTVNETSLQPFLNNEIGHEEALERAVGPVRSFMITQTREKDLALMVQLSGMERPENMDGVPTAVLIPAFMISELKTAFQIGMLLYVPFLIMDLVVASVLLSMGMMMLPPVMISLPFKLMLFVLADGWHLIVGSLIKSFG